MPAVLRIGPSARRDALTAARRDAAVLGYSQTWLVTEAVVGRPLPPLARDPLPAAPLDPQEVPSDAVAGETQRILCVSTGKHGYGEREKGWWQVADGYDAVSLMVSPGQTKQAIAMRKRIVFVVLGMEQVWSEKSLLELQGVPIAVDLRGIMDDAVSRANTLAALHMLERLRLHHSLSLIYYSSATSLMELRTTEDLASLLRACSLPHRRWWTEAADLVKQIAFQRTLSGFHQGARVTAHSPLPQE